MMKRCLALVVGLVAVFVSAKADDESLARLLVHKRILNKYLVEGKDLVVEYIVYNVGGSAAVNVQLTDNSFAPGDFDLVNGMLKVKIDRLGPGSNVSHTVVVRPVKYGYYNFTSAEVTYQPSDESKDIQQIGFSTEPGEGGIIAFKDYNRKFSPHILDWAAFAVMTLPSLGIPFLLWFSSKSKYESIVKQAKKH